MEEGPPFRASRIRIPSLPASMPLLSALDMAALAAAGAAGGGRAARMPSPRE